MRATANYDILVQLHENLINKSLAMLFYSGKIHLDGLYAIEKNIPDSFKPFASFQYEISLTNEPFIDFQGSDKVYIRFGSELKLIVLGGVEVSFTLDFSVNCEVSFDVLKQKMFFLLKKTSILKLGAEHKYYIGKEFLSRLNFIVDEILNKYFKNEVKAIDIPVALNGLTLPLMPKGREHQMPILQADVKILDKRVLALGISFFHKKGSLADVFNASNNKDCYIAISEDCIVNTFNFWWGKTLFEKKQTFNERVAIGFAAPLAGGVDVATRLLTLGFIQTETEYDNLELECEGFVFIEKQPKINLNDENKIEITDLEFIADIAAFLEADVKKQIEFDRSSFIPNSLTPWKDNKILSNTNEHKKILDLKDTFSLKVEKAQGCLRVNKDNNLAVKITDADFKIEFSKKGTTFSDQTWQKLMLFLKERVLERIPELVVSPSLILAGVNVFGFSLSLNNTDLTIADNDVVLRTNLTVNELKSNTVAVPNYVADEKNRIVHLFSCEDVLKIAPQNRSGFYVMYESLASGYKPCSKCLKGYQLNI